MLRNGKKQDWVLERERFSCPAPLRPFAQHLTGNSHPPQSGYYDTAITDWFTPELPTFTSPRQQHSLAFIRWAISLGFELCERQGGIPGGGNLQDDSSLMSAAGSAERRPARRSAQPTCPIWRRRDRGIRGTRGMGSPLPRPTPPGLQGRSLSGGGRRPGARTATPAPNSIWDPRRHEKQRAWPFRDAFSYPPEERQRGRFLTLRQKRSFYREEREGAKRGRSPSLPKGSRGEYSPILRPSLQLGHHLEAFTSESSILLFGLESGKHLPIKMESFLLDDIGSMIQNKAIERIISPMTVQLCHLIISMERKDMDNEVFASLEKMAEELAQASEEFVQIAQRLAGNSEEVWLQEEMGVAAESLILSSRNITLVAQKLHLQPECQSHQEELVTTAQHILVDTTKVLLLEDTATARKMILDTFTDTQSPLQRLVRAALATPSVSSRCDGEALPESLQLLLAAFHDQANRMLRVAHLVLVCCPRQQTGKDMEATMVGLWGLVVRVQQLFSQSTQGSACFDDVLDIPEFLSVSIQEMTKHLDFFTWALRSGDSREFSPLVAYLQGRGTHIVQVMGRYVDQDRDPIFRNGLRVLIQQLEQSSRVLGAAGEHCSGGHGSQDTDALLTLAKHVISSAQSIREGLDGTNHPDILSPLRDQVQRFDMAERRPYFILSSLQDCTAPALKHQREPGLGKSDRGASYPPRDHLFCPLILDTGLQKVGSPLPAISKPMLAVDSLSHQGVTSAHTILQDQDAAVEAAQEALAGEGPLASERMTGLQEIPSLAPSIIDLAREIEHCTTARTDGLLEVALQLSGKTRETRQSLVAIAGDWYSLCQQLFCNKPAADLQENMTVFMELQQNLASVVQLAVKSGPMDSGKKDSDSTGHPEAHLQVQGRLEEAETHAKQLLDKVLASDGFQAPGSWEESIEDGCLLWSVAVQDLLQCLERLSGRQGLFLLPLRQAVKDQQGLQEGLAQAADVSQRLQEAARLSCLLCGDEQVKGEISFLCREVHVLTDALLDVAQILASFPKPSPSLSTRFELLCLELTLQAKALTGHLSSINADYERVLQGAFCPRLSVCKDPQTRPEGSLQRMVSGIQAVQGIVAGGQESGPCQEDLLMALESILVLTKEVAQRVPVLRECPEGWLQQEWAAKAHHAVAQLQAWKGGHTKAWRLLAQCLKPSDEEDPTQPQLHRGEGASGAAEASSVDSQGAAPRDTPGSSVGTCIADPGITRTVADLGMSPKPPVKFQKKLSWCPHVWRRLSRAAGMWGSGNPLDSHSSFKNGEEAINIPTAVQRSEHLEFHQFHPVFFLQHQHSGTPGGSPGCPAWPHTEVDLPLPEDGSVNSGNRITQVTQEMAKEVFLMAQSLRRRGCILVLDLQWVTKEQLITSARKIATSGQNFARLIRIMAKNCVDQRCSQELLYMVEQIQTMSSQLRVISSVKASLARSKSSEELLVENAQRLLRAVSKTVRAAEAASLRGLRQPSPDPEELEVAAFCMQWRRKLRRHRLQETSDPDRDELGLRKTSTKGPPTLVALVQEAL
ncbi:hypothetical protein E2I00_016621 [Balaenoptera physalus]|uniref:Vinculin n=1 Tax=Balaenoptera physalus TaxID=9770 RepID=A0A643CEU5_BALPH|nr:hypothetical protein E2I00_016621 [Balaenoptera physalus]